MWIYTTNNEMINISHAERMDIRQEMSTSSIAVESPSEKNMTGVSIIAHFADSEVQLAYVPAAPNYDLIVTRYWNAIRTAIKSRAELCDLMDIV